MTGKAEISIAIITHNEEDNIQRCLDSLTFAGEIVIVDSGSNDATVSIAEQHDSKIFHQEWSGFADQKQFAIDHCTNEWILIVDADESIPPATAQEIRTILANPGHKAYSLPRHNFFHNKKINHGSWGSDCVVRLLQKKYCRMSTRLVHEEVLVNGTVGQLSNPIHHWPRRNLSFFLQKADTYSTLGAGELFASGEKVSLFTSFTHSLWCFLYNYIIRRGFLDGGPGLIIAFADSIDTFFKYAKCWELQHSEKKSRSTT